MANWTLFTHLGWLSWVVATTTYATFQSDSPSRSISNLHELLSPQRCLRLWLVPGRSGRSPCFCLLLSENTFFHKRVKWWKLWVGEWIPCFIQATASFEWPVVDVGQVLRHQGSFERKMKAVFSCGSSRKPRFLKSDCETLSFSSCLSPTLIIHCQSCFCQAVLWLKWSFNLWVGDWGSPGRMYGRHQLCVCDV